MFDLSGKAALVTGATGGLGAAIARALHGQGATSPCLGEHLTVWPIKVRDGEVFTA